MFGAVRNIVLCLVLLGILCCVWCFEVYCVVCEAYCVVFGAVMHIVLCVVL